MKERYLFRALHTFYTLRAQFIKVVKSGTQESLIQLSLPLLKFIKVKYKSRI